MSKAISELSRSAILKEPNFVSKIKFMFSKKDTKIDEIFTADLTLCSKFQTVSEDFVKFCALLRKHELYQKNQIKN